MPWRLPKRWIPERWRRPLLPGALIIGAQKSGTTALAAYLSQHPRLACAHEKEVDFFGSDLRYAQGLDWYAAQWPATAAQALRFEASPQYLWRAATAAPRIHAAMPSVRLIAVLRDPIERAYSAWRMYRRQLAGDPLFYEKFFNARYGPGEYGRMARRSPAEFDDFGLAIRREVAALERGVPLALSLLDLGLYGDQLRTFVRTFTRQQLLILEAEDLRYSRVMTLNRILEHLSLEPSDWSNADLDDVFVGSSGPPLSAADRSFLSAYYADSDEALAELLGAPPTWVARRSNRSAA